MRVYKFHNILGTVYRQGNISFAEDGDSVWSPIGNRVGHFELTKHESHAISVEGSHNYTAIDVHKNGKVLAAGNEIGEVHIISLTSETMLHVLKGKGPVKMVRFSPDGQHLAVAKKDVVLIFQSPTAVKCFNPFVMKRVFHDSSSDLTSLDWSDDSVMILTGSGDAMMRIYSMKKFSNFKTSAFTSHAAGIANCFFAKDSYDMYSLCRDGKLCVWAFSMSPEELVVEVINDSGSEEADEVGTPEELLEKRKAKKGKKPVFVPAKKAEKPSLAHFKREATFFYSQLFDYYEDAKRPTLECADFNKKTNLVVAGFENGIFHIHELPSFTLVQSLNINWHKISTIKFNNTGDWVAFGCPTGGQLLVWEWQSECKILHQQGHFDTMSVCEYSLSGNSIVTGGEDGKVKVWKAKSAYCFVTFHEHSSCVTGAMFTQDGKAVVSSSIDGTVRAFDLLRYRNFRTFTSPKPVQFSCVTIDSSKEFVAAGTFDVFDIFLWSMKTGRLLEILTGHEGPIASLSFNPTSGSTQLSSVSWDNHLRVWEAIENSGTQELVPLGVEGTCIGYRPDGKEIAVGTLKCHILFFDPATGAEVGSIEGRNHLGGGILDTDLVSAAKNLSSNSFTTLSYSPDGLYLLAAGRSKYVCYYNASRRMLLMKFQITQNKSLDGMGDFIHHRKLTEFGSMAELKDRDDSKDTINLPGVKKGDMSSRSTKPEVRVSCVRFSPTGSEWIATTTEGLLLYDCEKSRMFNPIGADLEVTPDTINQALLGMKHDKALTLALHLNIVEHIRRVVESIHEMFIYSVCESLAPEYLGLFLRFLASEVAVTQHIGFYFRWITIFLRNHLTYLTKFDNPEVIRALNTLEKNMTAKKEELFQLSSYNMERLELLCSKIPVVMTYPKQLYIHDEPDTNPVNPDFW